MANIENDEDAIKKRREEYLQKRRDWKRKNSKRINCIRRIMYILNREKILSKKKDNYNKNRDSILRKTREYRARNKDKQREYRVRHNTKNREKILNRKKIFYQANKERLNKEHADRCRRNREKYSKTRREYYKRNKERINRNHKEYLLKDREKYLKNARDRGYKSKYGIGLDGVSEMYKKQKGICLACGEGMDNLGEKKRTGKSPCVDHCHKTGKVRAIIHNSCNTIIGLAGENYIKIKKISQYTKLHSIKNLKYKTQGN